MRVVTVVCVATIAGTCGVARAEPGRIVSVRTPPAAELTAFWTPQRLKDAAPTPVPVVAPTTPGAAGPDNSQSQAVGPAPSTALPSSVSGNVTTRPLYWAGKLVYAKPAGTSYCSAQFIAPGILLTAAHCVRDDNTGAWFTNFLYAHRYQLGKSARNLGTECAASYEGWLAKDDSKWAWDYAMIKVRGGIDLGHFGTQWGWRGQYNTAPKIGYPQDIERGEVIQVDFGKLIKGREPGIVGLVHNNPRNQEGSSGGAWIGNYDTSENSESNYVISVTSHYVGDDRSSSFGPYWDENFESLMAYTRRGCR
jgi:hypothetical protein